MIRTNISFRFFVSSHGAQNALLILPYTVVVVTLVFCCCSDRLDDAGPADCAALRNSLSHDALLLPS